MEMILNVCRKEIKVFFGTFLRSVEEFHFKLHTTIGNKKERAQLFLLKETTENNVKLFFMGEKLSLGTKNIKIVH